LFGDGGYGGRVVHQGVLQGQAGCGGGADVVVRGDEGDVAVGVEACLPCEDWIQS
jgi:hypothetical protein